MRRIAFLFLLATAGCVSEAARRGAELAGTVGLSETDLVRRFGVPNRTYDVGGHRFLDYDDRHLVTFPGFATYGAGFGRFGGPGFGAFDYVPPEVVERGCDTTFELAGGRVLGWALRGRACG